MAYRRWNWGLLAYCAIVTLADFLAQCFQCVPLPGLWNKSVKARCFAPAHMTQITKFQGGSAVITDILCVLLPMLVLRNLQVSQREKIAIFVVIGFGFFTAATAIARTSLVDFTSKNPTWDLIPVAIWSCLEQNIGVSVASLPALPQLLNIRKQPYPSRSSEGFCNHHHHNTRPPLNAFAMISDSDRIRLPNDVSSTETSSREELSTLTPKMSDIESYRDTRASLISLSMVSPPLWTDRKISSAETVEMSRVSPTPTFVERKPSSREKLRLSMVAPSWGHKKTSSADKAYSPNNRRLSMVSPLSLDRPPSPFSAARVQQLGKFEETGLRHSRVATPEEMVSLGNQAACGYSCTIEGGTPKGTP
ncbi:hypothetical protein HO133_000749 [Letharia lupina]|uniref:Rhodopsin domain-containing protein n=1 Tax=Letharia lupina TaxID=560253 RepID=A0A8H6CFU8_9LECA|nr:uncharacterized protein HO133_000749 [Letharia lupina]KAF6222702.1 hypothetical protein HO133_000749 [Letharia lupina]